MHFAKELPNGIKLRIQPLKSAEQLPTNTFLVYILTYNGKAIVVGHGKKNRAKVIFDSKDKGKITGHIKALFVRVHLIYGGNGAVFKRYVVRCKTKEEASKLEKQIQNKCGGDTLVLPETIKTKLFKGIKRRSPTWMVLKMATYSAYDGIADLKRWKNKEFLDDVTWKQIWKKLMLPIASRPSRDAK